MRATVLAAAIATLALLPGSAAAVGPSLPAVNGGPGVVGPGGLRYAAVVTGTRTRVTARRPNGVAVRAGTLAGAWGVPLVTLRGALGGVSASGRVLVLSDDLQASTTLRARSRFAILDATTLALRRAIALRGDWSFDALSPDGRTLYLIQHVTDTGAVRYRVRAYDLAAGRLIARVIADKRQAGWLMTGYPVTRATSAGGRWVYTLYQRLDGYPFVHALDTMTRTAVCIGLPWQWSNEANAIGTASLRLRGHTLAIAGGAGSATAFRLDTETFRVTTS